jgi:hypothetical protein
VQPVVSTPAQLLPARAARPAVVEAPSNYPGQRTAVPMPQSYMRPKDFRRTAGFDRTGVGASNGPTRRSPATRRLRAWRRGRREIGRTACHPDEPRYAAAHGGQARGCRDPARCSATIRVVGVLPHASPRRRMLVGSKLREAIGHPIGAFQVRQCGRPITYSAPKGWVMVTPIRTPLRSSGVCQSTVGKSM